MTSGIRKIGMSRLTIALGALATLLLNGIACEDKFPARAEIDNVLEKFRSEPSFERRVELLGNFVGKLRNPSNASDDQNVNYAMDRLAKIFKETGDESVLVAIDGTKIQAGFANFVCGFYSAIKNESKFKARYLSDTASRKPIERCIGISFSQEEIEDLARRAN
jgi:hypothetical protein